MFTPRLIFFAIYHARNSGHALNHFFKLSASLYLTKTIDIGSHLLTPLIRPSLSPSLPPSPLSFSILIPDRCTTFVGQWCQIYLFTVILVIMSWYLVAMVGWLFWCAVQRKESKSN
jgi:hypothetical protein